MEIKSFGPKELNLVQILNKESNKTAKVAYLPYIYSCPFILGKKNNSDEKNFIRSFSINPSKMDIPLCYLNTNVGYSLLYFLKRNSNIKL